MRYSKLVAMAVVAAGVMICGTQAKAEEPYEHGREASHVDRFAGAHDPAPPPVKVPVTAAP